MHQQHSELFSPHGACDDRGMRWLQLASPPVFQTARVTLQLPKQALTLARLHLVGDAAPEDLDARHGARPVQEVERHAVQQARAAAPGRQADMQLV